MVDALALKSDEGRGMAAISFGDVPGNSRSEDFRMGKPLNYKLRLKRLTFVEHT